MYKEELNDNLDNIQDEYINERIDAQIEYYTRKANAARSLDRWSKVITIIFASLIPVIVTIGPLEIYSKVLIVILSMSIVVFIGIQQIFQTDRVWKEYLDASVKLRHEKMLYLTNMNEYKDERHFHELVGNIENILSNATNTKISHVPQTIVSNYWQNIEKTSNK